MPKFETPEPISVNIGLAVGQIRVAASDRTDTVVEVHPSDEADASDVKAAAQVSVDYTSGMLQITGPKRTLDFSRKTKSVSVSIALPSGSQLSAHLQMGDLHCTGRLGDCRIKTTGNVRIEQTGPLRLHTGFGHVTADRITGDAEISTGTGTIHIGEIERGAEVKNSNGDTSIEAVSGDIQIRNANGAIAIERAGAEVDAKTSNGGIRLGEVTRGSVEIGTAAGNLEIGIAEGTAAWLELNTGFGYVRNQLENAPQPHPADETVEIRGRTSYGDITIRRS